MCALWIIPFTTPNTRGTVLYSTAVYIIHLVHISKDLRFTKVLTEQQYIVRPGGQSDLNENVLGEQCREDYGLTEEQVKDGQPLENVIDSFNAILTKICGGDTSRVSLVTQGQLHLRQVVHPKALANNMNLPDYYNSFYDLNKEFQTFYHSDDVATLNDMLNYLTITGEECTDLATRSVRDMSKVLARMVQDGHRFVLPETVVVRLEPGICSRTEEVDSGCVVRARGLPWQSSDQDIAKFFRGLNIAKGGVALCLSPQGRRNGEALIRFVSAEHRDMALKRHKHHIGNRYIEVYKATGDDFINVAGGKCSNNEAQQFLSRGGQVIIRMRGLPYDCTPKQVVEFFESGDNGCQILDGEEGVLFVRKPDGRATGDAFVLFATEEDSTRALAKHREIIGSRYIELFRSTTAEVQQVLNRSMDPRTYEQQQPLIAQLPQVPILPQQIITSGTRKDCIRLRGLPFEAQVEHILEFLGEHAKNIVFQGVHMVYNAAGQPSGEAFIQMDSEHSSFMASQQRHHRYMPFGKKQRYIEVFQCSGEDMHMVLTGGLPTQPRPPVVSPGMLMWDPQAAAALPPPAAGVPSQALVPAGHAHRSHGPPHFPHSPANALTQGIPPPSHALIPGMPPTMAQKPDTPLLLTPPMLPPQHRPTYTPQTPALTSQPPPQLLPHMLPVSSQMLFTKYSDNMPTYSQAGATTPNVMFFNPAAGKFPMTSLTGGLPSQIAFMQIPTAAMQMPISSPQESNGQPSAARGAGQHKPPSMAPPLLPMPYAALAAAGAAAAMGRIPGAAGNQKRNFDQAFPGDAGVAGGVKRTSLTSPNGAPPPLLHPVYPPPQMFQTM
ncbi:unnamed protein product, partial [Meganyctiphanes norvegica]